MFWNIKKPICKILSMILVCAMSVSLLSGCGPSTGKDSTAVTGNKTQQSADAEQQENKALAEKTEETEKILEELTAAINEGDKDRAGTLSGDLAEITSEAKEETEKWLAAGENGTEGLTADAKKTLEKRRKAFEKEIKAGEKQTGKLLKKLGKAVSKGDMAEAEALTEQIKGLLLEENEPRTYGEELAGEAEACEASEETLSAEPENTQEARNMEAEPETEQELSVYLKNEGDTALNERIKEKADELGTPLAVYNYLKNNIGYESYYGSRKGAAGTFDAMNGNDMDQASLLIAMLRHLGCPAEYVKGSILLTGEQAVSLTGADTPRHASDVLASAGVPVTRLTRNGEIAYIRMEHVWVRAYVPYTDYRGAGNAGGDPVWIDLDTGIKGYEDAENIYNALEAEGFGRDIENLAESGDASRIESVLGEWEEKLSGMDTEGMYARKRIISQKDESYLPLSLQYKVEKEDDAFAQVPDTAKDHVSFEVNGEPLAGYTAGELQGKDIILSFEPADAADKEIYESYAGIFDIPAYAVYMKPVLVIDGEVAAEGESMLESTLGTKGSFTISISSGGRNTTVTNDITTGSMYAVTLDSQSITAQELQAVYDEAAALKDSVTEDNVYSREYLGKLLSLAGKLYFAQVDIADMVAAETYGVQSVRSLSEGITGYEVRKNTLYGRVTSLSAGSLYIDIDTDAHVVASLTGDAETPKQYMMSTGMIGSLYESTVWEQLTGYESVSTISILARAQEEGTDILLISGANLSEEIEKLNTDSVTKQEIINAVNAGMTVTIPSKNVTIGDWTGTGYIVMNPETGYGEYRITGGYNGGALTVVLTIAVLCAAILLLISMEALMAVVVPLLVTLFTSGATLGVAEVISLVLGLLGLGGIFKAWCSMLGEYNKYLLDGDLEAAENAAKEAKLIGIFSLVSGVTVKIFPKTSVVDKAKAWQTSVEYPNADNWVEITLHKGDTVWGGTPGQSFFYTSDDVMNIVGTDATKLYNGLQVGKGTYPQYRECMTQYIVKEDITVAYSKALANPQYGDGGFEQFFIDQYERVLEAIKTITMTNR